MAYIGGVAEEDHMSEHDKDKDEPQAPATVLPEAQKETAIDAYRRILLNDPQFVEAKPSGKAFVIVGAKP
jgi:hypothetical protein